MKKWYILILLAFSLSPLAFSQIDTAFWFAAPSLTTSHIPNNIWMVVVTYGDGAEVSITQPARGRTLMTERRIEANSTFTYSIKSDIDYRNSIETQADQMAHDNGILVRSSVPVSVYYVATNPNSEIYTLKGHHGLGTDFIVPMQNIYQCNHNGAPAYCSIEMVATEDNTTIEVHTTQPTNELAAAGTITITLDRGQSYAIRSRDANTPANAHLGGTHIISDKPIAVNTTDDSAETGNDKDLIGEQLVPTVWAGSHYIAVANNSNHEYAFFYTINNAPVEIYTMVGTVETLVGKVQPGQPLQKQLTKLSAQPFYTKDNSPFILFQMTGNGGELSGTVLPSLNCSGSDEVSYIPALNTIASNVTILTRTEFIDGFSVNGDASRLSASSFLPVPGMPEWSYTPSKIIQLEGSEKTLRIRNHKGVFHLGVLDATGGAVSYGYFSNFGKISMSCSTLQNVYYEGQDIHFHLVAGETYDSIWWEGPKGIFGYNDSTPVIYNATRSDRGMYVVNGIPKEGCELEPDSFFLTILEAVGEPFIQNVCYGDPVTVKSKGDAPYMWFKDDDLMPEQTSSTYTYTPTSSSSYTISSTTAGENVVYDGAIHPYTYTTESDTAIMWAETYKHCIPGEEYVFTVSLGVTGTNPVAPRLLLYVNGEYSETRALPNNSTGQKLTLRFTPQDRYAVMRLMAVNTKPNRHFNLEAMSLKPVLSKTELIDVHVSVAPVAETPQTIVDYCDTLPAYVWRDQEITQPGTYYDTTFTALGCDSVYYTLIFDTIHCFDPVPVQFSMDSLWMACDGDDSIQISYKLASGTPSKARVYINDSLYLKCAVSSSTTSLYVPLPSVPNNYTMCLVLENPSNHSLDSVKSRLTLQYDPEKVFAHKWNNVLAIFSPAYSGYPNYNWLSYRWYRDGVDLGETYSYYRVADSEFVPSDCYQVLLTRAEDGVTLFTCPYCIQAKAKTEDANEPNTKKIIRQGRLILSVDGIEYNALGTRQ